MVSLPGLAKAKGIPVSFLAGLGVCETGDSLLIPYRMMDGSLAPRQRLRIGLSSKDGFRWKGDGDVVPYGLDRLNHAKASGYLILVEGESDCWTLWYNGFPALGIPGSSMSSTIKAAYLDGIAKIYVWQEPDKAGGGFVSGISKRLFEISWPGDALVLKLDGMKDPNEIHLANKDRGKFKKILRYLMLNAKSLPKYTPPKPRQFRKSDGDIDDDKIKRAASVPLSELVESKNGFILCPMHKDTKPSMWIKNGFGYCFVCSKSMNSIQYLRQTMGYSFKDAVLALQNK